MSYGVDGQARPGTSRTSSPNTRTSTGAAGNVQSQRGYGPSRFANAANRGRPSPLAKIARGFRQIKTNSPTTRNTSAGRIRRSGGKG